VNIAGVVSELKAERTRIDGAIRALEGLSSNGAATSKLPNQAITHSPKRGHLSAAGRKRLSEMMKKRWAERRKKASARK